MYVWMFAQHLAHLAGAATPCACNEERSDHAITLPCDRITDELFSHALESMQSVRWLLEKALETYSRQPRSGTNGPCLFIGTPKSLPAALDK
jgi:hypothetical protein